MLCVKNFLLISVAILANTLSAENDCWKKAFGEVFAICDKEDRGNTDMGCIYRKIGLLDEDSKVHPQKMIEHLAPLVVNQTAFKIFERENKLCAKTVERESFSPEDTTTYIYFCHLEAMKSMFGALGCTVPDKPSNDFK